MGTKIHPSGLFIKTYSSSHHGWRAFVNVRAFANVRGFNVPSIIVPQMLTRNLSSLYASIIHERNMSHIMGCDKCFEDAYLADMRTRTDLGMPVINQAIIARVYHLHGLGLPPVAKR